MVNPTLSSTHCLIRLVFAVVLAGTPLGSVADDAATPEERGMPVLKDELKTLAEERDATGLGRTLDEAAGIDLQQALGIAARPEYQLEDAVVAGRWRPSPENISSAFQTTVSAPSSSYRDHLLLGIVNEWVKRDPRKAKSAIASLPDDGQSADLSEQFNLAMVRFRPADALKLAVDESGQPGAIKVRAAAVALARTDLAQAVNILETLTDKKPEERKSVVAVIASRWAEAEPSAAAEWAEKLTGDGEAETAYEEIAYRWAKDDLSSCGTWVEKLASGSPRDAALRAIVFEAVADDVEQAFAWALLVDDPNLKETLLSTAVSSWVLSDLAAAASAVESASLSEDERKVLGELLEPE